MWIKEIEVRWYNELFDSKISRFRKKQGSFTCIIMVLMRCGEHRVMPNTAADSNLQTQTEKKWKAEATNYIF